MRLKDPFTAFASVLIAKVLANPGTPSNKICPCPNKPISKRSIMCFCPTIVLFISAISKSINALSRSILSLIERMSVVDVVASIILFSVCINFPYKLIKIYLLNLLTNG